MKIDLFTFLGPNAADYAEFLKYTCEKFISGKHEINWKCIESVGADRIPKGYKCVDKGPNLNHNSLSHGAAVNLIQKHIESEYVIVIDADVAIVYPGWDDVIVNELNNYDCFGGAYAHGLKYKDFPTVYLFSFRRHILDKVELDFRPKITKGKESPYRYTIKDAKEAEYFGKKIGGIIKCDTGWRLPLIIKGAGFTSKAMPMILTRDKNSQLPFENRKHKNFCFHKPSHMHEWHYDGKLFGTHKQACRSHALNSEWGKAWKKRIELYMKE